MLVQWRIWCQTEEQYVYTWSATKPEECPNDSEHEIDTTSISIIDLGKRVVECQYAQRNPTSTDDIDSGFEPGANWLNTETGKIYGCTDNTSGSAIWVDITGLGTVKVLSSIDWCYTIISSGYGSIRNYARVKGNTWVSLGVQVFAGTTTWIPSLFKAVAELNSSGTGYIRLYDLTNNETLAEITVTDTSMTIYTDNSLSNLPDSEAVIEVQAKTQNSSTQIYIYSAHLWSV